ncbi:hypothetical protein [Rubritalea tangerina]|uniref:hypothetical protein n=1 Tax=Rubritalea tangerina TaxID=430798 RepID=UPI003609678B
MIYRSESARLNTHLDSDSEKKLNLRTDWAARSVAADFSYEQSLLDNRPLISTAIDQLGLDAKKNRFLFS